MGKLVIHPDKIQDIKALVAICPFGAMQEQGGSVEITAACRLCKLCVKKGGGAVEFVEEEQQASIDKSKWQGIAVYIDHVDGRVHPVSYELLGKARELADKIQQEVLALFMGENIGAAAEELRHYGADRIFVCDKPALAKFNMEPYANVFAQFIRQVKPAAILVGATPVGRQLAPRVAARFHTGLTADCTVLDIRENTDLVQIRPAFGGNIVATIVNPENRPQMATVRSGVMKAEILDPNYKGEVILQDVAKFVPETEYVTKVLDRHVQAARNNLKGAAIIVAGGYGVGSREGFGLLYDLAKVLHAEVGASRAAVDAGFCDHDLQIGQTGVTVRPKVYIACGISGAIQHVAGMKESGIIISVNSDENAPINQIADYVINGTVEEVLPKMIKYYKQNSK